MFQTSVKKIIQNINKQVKKKMTDHIKKVSSNKGNNENKPALPSRKDVDIIKMTPTSGFSRRERVLEEQYFKQKDKELTNK